MGATLALSSVQRGLEEGNGVGKEYVVEEDVEESVAEDIADMMLSRSLVWQLIKQGVELIDLLDRDCRVESLCSREWLFLFGDASRLEAQRYCMRFKAKTQLMRRRKHAQLLKKIRD